MLEALVARVGALANRAHEHSSLNVRQRLYAGLLRLVRISGSGGGLIKRRRGAIVLLDADRLRRLATEPMLA